MIAAVTLLVALVAQDTGAGLSPRARAMIDRFPLPRGGEVAVDTRFNVPQAYVGEQVELLTAAWFPRDLRERLRRQPTLRAPALTGFWRAPTSNAPTLADSRRIAGRLYDLFVAHQTLFPLGPGTIEAPPAVLTYAVPSSASFFAPEDRKSLESRPVRIRILPVPDQLVSELGNGPTARSLRVGWRLPNQLIEAGRAITVELVVSGDGNVTLWPAPAIIWPVGIRVYEEQTQEKINRVAGIVTGEKRFRFTLVPDSAGVLTLPSVSYPYFDPARVVVLVPESSRVSLVVQPPKEVRPEFSIPLVEGSWVPLATVAVSKGWPILLILVLSPFGILIWRRRTTRQIPVPASTPDPADQLRRLAGRGLMREPIEMERALRHRGVPAKDARAVRDWLQARSRHRWARGAPPAPIEPAVARVVARLSRHGTRLAILFAVVTAASNPVSAQMSEAVARYRTHDAAGSARLFERVVEQTPDAPGAWLNLGIARSSAGDPIGAAAAWLQGLELAPRSTRLRRALRSNPDLPDQVERLAPFLPVSRDELILIAVATWLLAAWLWRTRRRAASGFLAIAIVTGAVALTRSWSQHTRLVLVRQSSALSVSPTPTASAVAMAEAWAVARVERRRGDWALVRLSASESRGWIPLDRLAPLSLLD